MRRLISLLVTATLAVFVGASVVGAQGVGPTYTSPTSTLSFQVREGWEPLDSDPGSLHAPWTEMAQAVFPADGRIATVGVHPLPAELAVDETYKALMDADVATLGGQLVSSEVFEVPGLHSASGMWTGIFQIYTVAQGDASYEIVRYMLPVGTQQYALSIVGGPGSASISGGDLGHMVGTLVP